MKKEGKGKGMSYDISDKFQVFVEGRYTYSLTDQQKKYMINQVARYNDTYGVSIGFLLNLKSIFNPSDRY